MARPCTPVATVHVTGPLAPFAEGYRAKLRDLGYTPLTTVVQLRQLKRLSRWLEAHEMTATDVSRERLEEFVATQRCDLHLSACSLQVLIPLLGVLVDEGVDVPEPPAPKASPCAVLIASFRHYLVAERRLADSTAAEYAWRAHRFLVACAPDAEVRRLTGRDVTQYVLRHAGTASVALVQHIVVALRSFLRFCLMEGLVDTDLSEAALAMTGRRHSCVPRGVGVEDVKALLRSCDRRHAIGRRDSAVLVVLSRLGLRASEVAAITLQDIDWRAGEVVVRGKGGRLDRLPLPSDVGEAIAGYLHRGRPRTELREVFVRAVAPIAPLGRGGVSSILRRACHRAGVSPIGSHRLRHTVACDLVAAGVPLTAIGELLRHRSVASTAIYARVDLEALRTVAQPWPGARRP